MTPSATAGTTLGVSFVGAIFAQATNNPTVTFGTILLALIGLIATLANILAKDREGERAHSDTNKENLKLRTEIEQLRDMLSRLGCYKAGSCERNAPLYPREEDEQPERLTYEENGTSPNRSDSPSARE